MSRIIKDLEVQLDEDLEEKLTLLAPGHSEFRVLRQSVDARRSRSPHFVYSVEVFDQGETPPPRFIDDFEKINFRGQPPIVIGAGPAGLFAALRLLERGIPCKIFERGSPAEKRLLRINRYWRYGELDADDNVCFGEGGAGLYSDGKLITRIKSPHIKYVLNRLVQFGAPAEIEYLSNPHVGSDRIRRIIPKIRERLIELGCEIHYNTPIENFVFSDSNTPQITGVITRGGQIHHSEHVILATGHSAEDIFHTLHKSEVKLEGKSFAMGLRIEHPQKMINKIQYREAFEHPKLGSANYRLAHHDRKTEVGVYSFCMCPGGYVVSSGTEANGLVCNGMSNYNRNSPFANSAIAVSIDFESWFGNDLFAGMKLRRELEQSTFQMVQKAGGSKELPAQMIEDFLNRRAGPIKKSSSPSKVVASRLDQLVPEKMFQPLVDALEKFDRKLPGFIGPEGQLHGVESRTSCPLRIPRDSESLQSLSHSGLYPVGEGAGYAGGITSAAVDGIRAAEAIAREFSHQPSHQLV